MRHVSNDQNGDTWDISWGILDEEAVLRDVFNVSGPFRRTDLAVTFRDPIYRNETKTLRVYETDDGTIVAMSEITPSVYAAGVKL